MFRIPHFRNFVVGKQDDPVLPKQLNFVQHFFDCYEKIEAVISSKNDSTELIQVIEMVYIVMFALLPFVSKYDLQHKNI